MTPSQATTPNGAVIIERLDNLSRQLSDVAEKIECLTKEQSAFIVQYTKAHTELEARIQRVDEKAERAHERIDAMTKIVWSVALPVIIGSLAFLWGILTHTVVIGGSP